MKKKLLMFLAGLATGTVICLTTVQAKSIGPAPIVKTDLSKGTIFAKPGGSGTTCSLAVPCDLWSAISKAKAGSVVFLRGGTYQVSKHVRFEASGTATAPIIFESYPGEHAVLDGGQLAKGTDIHIRILGKYIHLRGIEIRNMPRQGIAIFGSNNVLDGVHTHHNVLSGIQILSEDDGLVRGRYGSNNTIRNCISSHNSAVGLTGTTFANGGNSDGIALSSGTDNRVENCLVHNNSDDGIDTWRTIYGYVGYSISHSNGSTDGDGNGIKGGGVYPSAYTILEHNLSYSNKTRGITSNGGVNLTIRNNTTWNNQMAGYSLDSDAIVSDNISKDTIIKWGKGIESDNSWQRAGTVSFISTDSTSTNFLAPKVDGGFDDIGAYSNTDGLGNTLLPDLVVTQVSYANGIFTSTVKNQGSGPTLSGVPVSVAYLVDGQWRTWGGVWGPLAVGASVTIGTKGGAYNIPVGTHTIVAHVDDGRKVSELNDDNNRLSRSISVP